MGLMPIVCTYLVLNQLSFDLIDEVTKRALLSPLFGDLENMFMLVVCSCGDVQNCLTTIGGDHRFKQSCREHHHRQPAV